MKTNIDHQEVNKFSELAARWWDKDGEFKTLHDINPQRLAYISQRVGNLAGKTVIDVGCGGGILAEAMAAAQAVVTGIDMSEASLQVAQLHLHESNVNVDYQLKTAEQMAAEQPASFDIVTCMEMLEHVPHPQSVIHACQRLVKPNGHVFFSTLNRTLPAYLLAIVGAEYLLNLIAKGTHDYAKFIRPAELATWARQAGLNVKHLTGLHYSPLTHTATLHPDISVNYLVHTQKVA
jgi:2-polyprenyl-6-hydroxyphenyl methylase / 3-demethylubiquinone-9 3-methyltransferase